MEKIVLLPDIQSLAQELSDSLRLGLLAKSHQLTMEFVEMLNQYINQQAINNIQLNHILNIMLDTQQRDDRLYYADILQYELIPCLMGILQQNS